MEDEFKIYIDQLRDGHEQEISESFSPAFLDLHDDELAFEKNVDVNGTAYIAEDELLIRWSVEAEALVPCAICNEVVAVPIRIEDAYQAIPRAEIRSGIYSFKELLREALILEVPSFVECHGGKCPKRKEVKKYLKEDSSQGEADDEGYRPFADLKWD
jgi:uncharacterized metal-binding protein YceD (DUF177 family)